MGAKSKNKQERLEKRRSNDEVAAQHIQVNCVPFMFPANKSKNKDKRMSKQGPTKFEKWQTHHFVPPGDVGSVVRKCRRIDELRYKA